MTTYRVIIEDAMREAGILHKGENADADEAEDGLRVLNRMLASWRLSGIDLEYLPETTLADALPYPLEDEAPIVYGLALKLAGQFGIKVSNELAAYAGEGMRQIQSRYMKIGRLSVDPAIAAYNAPNTVFSR